jgi:hypothetical protein
MSFCNSGESALAWSATLPLPRGENNPPGEDRQRYLAPWQASVRAHLHTCINVSFREQNRSQVDPLLAFQVIARHWLFGQR